MTDLIDSANDKAQAWTDNNIEIARSALIANDTTDCVDCDEPIGAPRKQALPSATRCIGCQELHEAGK